MTAADLILLGASIRTLDPAQPTADAVAVRDGLVVRVGAARDVLELRGRETEVLELIGSTLLPGLVDGHTHPLLGVDRAVGVDLTGCRTLDRVQDALRAADARAGWLRAWGLMHTALGSTQPHRQLLDDISGARPALVLFFDGHAALANTAALQRAGIGRGPGIAGVVYDDAGLPTGHLLEDDAIAVVLDVAPRPAFGERRQALARVLHDMAGTGLTGGHVMDLDGGDLALYRSLDERAELPLRLRLAPWCRPGDDRGRLVELIALQRERGRTWRVGAVKFFIDGTIDGGTAWLDEPDTNGDSTGPYWPQPQRYREAVHQLAAAGVQTATHAIGDAAVRYVLDTLADAPRLRNATPHRIEHIETVADDQLPRFAELGVIASMQPTHATDYTAADGSDNWSTRLGPERAARGWRCRDLLAAGATVVLGSDWPVAHYDPRGVLAAAQTRRPPAHPDRPPVGAAQTLTAAQAIGACTRAAAVAAGDERGGRIAVGCRADFTALAADPLVEPAAQLPHVAVTATVMDGVVRYRAVP